MGGFEKTGHAGGLKSAGNPGDQLSYTYLGGAAAICFCGLSSKQQANCSAKAHGSVIVVRRDLLHGAMLALRHGFEHGNVLASAFGDIP